MASQTKEDRMAVAKRQATRGNYTERNVKKVSKPSEKFVTTSAKKTK